MSERPNGARSSDLSGRVGIDARELQSRIEAGDPPPVLDVRTTAEYSGGHVPGARNVPLSSIWSRAAGSIAKAEEPLVVYCGHGPRARIAAAVLRLRGFRHVLLLRGHMAGWRRAGLPEER